MVVVELLWSWVWVVMEVGVGCAQSSPQDTKPSNSAVVGCPRPLETPSFLGGLKAMIRIFPVSAILGSLSCHIRELESSRKVGEGRGREERSRTG